MASSWRGGIVFLSPLYHCKLLSSSSPGMNSILVYVSSDIFYNYFPFMWAEQGNSHLNYLSANIVAVVLWILLSYYWYKIDFFVKI